MSELVMANAYHGAALSLSNPKTFPRSFSDWYGKPVAERAVKEQSEQAFAASFLHWALSSAPPEKEQN